MSKLINILLIVVIFMLAGCNDVKMIKHKSRVSSIVHEDKYSIEQTRNGVYIYKDKKKYATDNTSYIIPFEYQ
ncbi:MAG: hypothetical protein PHX18_01990 [Candidatus Gastranaerophilales bacterium]|nr:hypothetical protein [Candidatus Gastranaerophilales bacterium]